MISTGLFLGRIPYIRGGAGHRTAVVFFGANALFQRLDRARPGDYARMVERILPRGYVYYILGYESEPPHDFGFHSIVADFAAFLRQHQRPLVVGVSFGGLVAQRLAADHPELVDRLVLLVSAHRFSAAGWRKLQRQESYMRQRDLYGFVKDMALLFRRPWYNWMLRVALWRGRRALPRRLNDPGTLLRVYESLFTNFENASYARRIRVPVLVVGATEDQFFDAEAYRETARLIPGARLHLFAAETHMVPLERARDVRAVITGFLGDGAEPSRASPSGEGS